MFDGDDDMSDIACAESKKDISVFYYVDKELAAAFKEDCELLLGEFKKSGSYKFAAFSAAWRACSFTHIYAGQDYLLIMRDFIENCFFIVKQYLTNPKDLFVRVGALYMLYGLYYKQPMKNWIKIRLTSTEYKHITYLIKRLNEYREYDAAYIFAKMKSEDCFQYVALSKALGPEDRFVKSFESNPDEVFRVKKIDDLFFKFQSIEDLDTVKKLTEINNSYKALFAKYAGRPLFESDIVKDIKNICGNMTVLPETSKNHSGNHIKMEATEHF